MLFKRQLKFRNRGQQNVGPPSCSIAALLIAVAGDHHASGSSYVLHFALQHLNVGSLHSTAMVLALHYPRILYAEGFEPDKDAYVLAASSACHVHAKGYVAARFSKVGRDLILKATTG